MTSSSKSSFKNAIFISNQSKVHRISIVVSSSIGEKVSQKSIPACCMRLLSTNRALYQSIHYYVFFLPCIFLLEDRQHPKYCYSLWLATSQPLSTTIQEILFPDDKIVVYISKNLM